MKGLAMSMHAFFRCLVLLLSAPVHLEVLLTGVDEVELDVQVEVVEVVLFAVNQVRLVVHEVVLPSEQLVILVVDVVR